MLKIQRTNLLTLLLTFVTATTISVGKCGKNGERLKTGTVRV